MEMGGRLLSPKAAGISGAVEGNLVAVQSAVLNLKRSVDLPILFSLRDRFIDFSRIFSSLSVVTCLCLWGLNRAYLTTPLNSFSLSWRLSASLFK